MSAYEFTVLDADCNAVDLNKYKGNVTLIVNTSRYDEKAQESYELLASIYQKYKDEDLSILLFPCAQFGAQTNARMEKEFLHNNNLSDAGTLFKEVDVCGTTTANQWLLSIAYYYRNRWRFIAGERTDDQRALQAPQGGKARHRWRIYQAQLHHLRSESTGRGDGAHHRQCAPLCVG